MTPADHLLKGERAERSMRKLAPGEDYLAIVDASLIAGYHWGNAILHRCGVLPDSDHANTPSKLGVPVDALPSDARAAFVAFAQLEKLRTDYVRSPSRYAEGIEEQIWQALATMRRTASG